MTSVAVRDLLLAATTVAVLLCFWFIRQLKVARDDLAHNQERLNLTLRASKIALWSWDIARNVITGDDSTSMLFGQPLGQFPKTVEGFAALIHPDDRQRVMREVTAVIENRADYDTEFRVVWPEGTIRNVAARAQVYGDAARQSQRLTGVCWDVTDRRLSEDSLRGANEQLTRSLEALERRKEEGVVLSEMADLLQACSKSTEAYDIVVRFCAHLFSTQAGALYIYSASRNLVNCVATWGNPVLGETHFEPDDCWALRRGHFHIVEPSRFATRCSHLKDIPRDGHGCFPLMAQGVGLGIIYLQQPATGTGPVQVFLTAEQQRLALTVAEQAGLSLANISLQEALRVQTIRDPLTGLFNRRYLEETVERELHRTARRDQSAALLMLDLDHFKTFNDTFGHEGGDALLRAFGPFLRDHLRKEDMACRYGGEEFCLLLTECSLEEAVRRADLIRSDLKRLAVQLGGRLLGTTTVSIGLAVYPLHGDTIGELVTAADGALYQAKAEGRDRTATATKIAVAPPI